MQLVPGHCGQHSPGSETGSAQGGGPQRRARHCTLPLCVQRWTGQAGLVAGAKETPAPAHPTAYPGLLKSLPDSPGLLLPSKWQTHQTVTQAAGGSGVGEVCSIGILFPSKGTAWGRGRL